MIAERFSSDGHGNMAATTSTLLRGGDGRRGARIPHGRELFHRVARVFVPPRWRPIAFLTSSVVRQTRNVVAAGPFVGMAYGKRSFSSAHIPKLLGIYERELTPAVERIVALCPDVVVNVGAAEGYYAVGMARRLAKARVLAFEADAEGRAALADSAVRNRVADRVTIAGHCSPDDLAETLRAGERAVVIMDVDGGEEALLDPDAVPGLATAAILVELHDFILPDIGETLRRRFAATHEIVEIQAARRSLDDFPARRGVLRLMPDYYVVAAAGEHRPAQQSWLWMEPAGPPSSPGANSG